MDITITTVHTGSVAMIGQSLPIPKCDETSEGVKIRTIDTLQTSGDNTLLFIHQYTVMEELLDQRPELEAMISPGDRFFMDFYMKQLVRSGKLKVLGLRKQIMEGSIPVETGREVAPRPDSARKRIREKYLEQRIERESDESNTPIS
ncbi:hypothetical protein L873DRAFT_1848882 [Choiromyces venosus 120613-1]|uniref:Uncharacterized protein n=1 Tax=Choiromyces venosus 120613-1 TaxID=1336337 RepID=A0A3N4IWA6_9PEZI|nr:hypothetical protein L873DRAFT_1848882 [Choiromyces venosus 120613-1]